MRSTFNQLTRHLRLFFLPVLGELARQVARFGVIFVNTLLTMCVVLTSFWKIFASQIHLFVSRVSMDIEDGPRTLSPWVVSSYIYRCVVAIRVVVGRVLGLARYITLPHQNVATRVDRFVTYSIVRLTDASKNVR